MYGESDFQRRPRGSRERFLFITVAVFPTNRKLSQTVVKSAEALRRFDFMGCVHGGQHKRPAKLALVRAFRRGRIGIWKIAYGCSRECQSDHQRIQRSRAPCSGCRPMRAHRGRYPGETSAANSAERTIAQELATADPLEIGRASCR